MCGEATRLHASRVAIAAAVSAGRALTARAWAAAVLALVMLAATVLAPSIVLADWIQEPYGEIKVTSGEAATLLVVENPPGGLYFKDELDRSKKYRLRVAGEGAAVLRIRQDGGTPRYMPAPNGAVTDIIDETAELEVLIYSDTPTRYEIASIELEECDDCLSAGSLRRLIQSELPRLDEVSHLEKAELLLQWAANATDFAMDAQTLNKGTEGLPPHQVYADVFEPSTGGVYCGGAATFYRSVLRLFGIDAFTINFGTPDLALTHVSVVVPQDGKFYLFDPTFAATFRSKEDFVPIQRLIAGELQDVELRELSLSGRDFLRAEPKSAVCRTTPTRVGELYACSIGDGSFVSHYLAHWAGKLGKAGIPTGVETLPELMRRGFFTIGPAMDPAVTEQFRKMLAEFDVPMH